MGFDGHISGSEDVTLRDLRNLASLAAFGSTWQLNFGPLQRHLVRAVEKGDGDKACGFVMRCCGVNSSL
jgi:hypothetical protein